MENNRRYTDKTTQEIDKSEKLNIDSIGLSKRSSKESTQVDQLKLRETDTEENKIKLLEGARQEFARLAGFTIVEKPEENANTDDQATQEVVVENVENTKELTPKETEELLNKLEIRFNDNSKLHKDMEFSKVKKAIEANKEAIWSLNEMEKAGHEPNILQMPDDKEGFYIITGSKETPESGRKCVYDQEVEDYLKENNPREKFNGNAVTQAENMGIKLEPKDQYRYMQTLDNFDEESWCWLETSDYIRKVGVALYGVRPECGVIVKQFSADNHDDSGAWRGSLRVLWN